MSGAYQPDAIVCFNNGGKNYFVTANEGDLRDSEEARVKDLSLDPLIFCKYIFVLEVKPGKQRLRNQFGLHLLCKYPKVFNIP